MSREKLAKIVCLTIIFGLFFYVVYLFVNYFMDKSNMNKLSNYGYEIIDDVTDYYTNNRTKMEISEFKIKNGKIDMPDDFKTNAVLPKNGLVKYSDGHIYIVLFDGKYCSYKRYNEGVMTSININNYDDCLKKAQTCPSGQKYNEGNCETES